MVGAKGEAFGKEGGAFEAEGGLDGVDEFGHGIRRADEDAGGAGGLGVFGELEAGGGEAEDGEVAGGGVFAQGGDEPGGRGLGRDGVEDDHVGRAGGDGAEGGVAGAGGLDGEAAVFEALAIHIGEELVFVDEEDALGGQCCVGIMEILK